jgi:hypothetical protein
VCKQQKLREKRIRKEVREDNGEQNLKSLWVNRRTSALL